MSQRLFHIIVTFTLATFVASLSLYLVYIGERGAANSVATVGGMITLMYFLFGDDGNPGVPWRELTPAPERAWRCGETIIDLGAVASIDRMVSEDRQDEAALNRANDDPNQLVADPECFRDTLVRYRGSRDGRAFDVEDGGDIFVLTDDEHEDLCDAFEEYLKYTRPSRTVVSQVAPDKSYVAQGGDL